MAKEHKVTPLCWKCGSRLVEDVIFEGRRKVAQKFIGCKKSQRITSYADAQEHCPLIKKHIERESE